MLSLRDLLLALLVVLVWGLNFVFIKWGVEEVPPLLLTGLRYLCAALPMVFFVRRPQVKTGTLVIYGLAIGLAQFGLLFSAIKLGMPAGLASLIIQTQAFFTIALAMLFLGEKLGRMQALGALVAIAGIGVIATERFEITALVPLLMVVLAALFWGVANIASKKAGQIDMLSFVVWGSLVPIMPLLALSLLVEGPAAISAAFVAISPRTVGIVLFNGYVATIIGFGLWSYLLKRYPAGLIAPFSLLVPVFGIGFAYLLLREVITMIEVVGSILVFAGLLLNVFGARLFTRPRTI
ncbi:EamA family transporter [Devosia psychrophila]|uniref:Acetylserine transporter n=1 Tax=Devosia psychrophila TaxID=728005 RepID=A0A0F5PXS3_9HYPH|nr:EamA family transporter [Devosia psychrophila]KKC33453.1 acetylserine transporter [Devosia psychrophila]SFB92323.1 O-acetylserine/cysteine efflux transporter [Devosia psychrophila]